MNINNDGSVQGELFTKVQGLGYPSPNHGKETYAEYKARVDALVEKGFHKGDLSWSHWEIYCKGSGMFDLGNGNIFDAGKII